MKKDIKDCIKIENLNKSYKKNINKMVFNNFNISFEEGKIHCILGASGFGKSTLLRIIAGLEKYESGNIIFERDLNLSMILQDNNLLPWLTVYDNIAFALKTTKKEDTNIEEKIDNILKQYKLFEYKKFYPFELSVGLKQKVTLAKALITNPSIVLLDEPFCALDFISKENIHDIFVSEYSKYKFTAILSTHYIEEAIKLGDYIHILGKDNKYKKIVNPLKKPRETDEKYHGFLDFIKKEYV